MSQLLPSERYAAVIVRIPERLMRAVLLVMSAGLALMCSSYFDYFGTTARVWHPEFVSICFGVSALLVFSFHLFPWSWRLFVLASASTMLAWSARFCSIVMGALQDPKPFNNATIKSQVGGLTFLLGMLALVWIYIILPWHKEHRAIRQERKRRSV